MMASNSKESPQSSSKLRVLILASEWGSSKGGLSTINRELAINLAKFHEVHVSFFVPRCNDEEKTAADDHNIDLIKAARMPGMDELQWLSFPPDDLHIDVVVGHGLRLGPQAQVIRKSHRCKWVQVVHTAPEELAMHKNYPNPISSGEKKHETEVELCKLADFVVTIGPKLKEAFLAYLSSCKKILFDFTPGIFSEFSEVVQVPDRSGKFRVLLIGRGDAEDFSLKGFDIAAKAVAALSNTHLIFVGAPEGKQEEIKNRFLKCGISAKNLTVRSFSPSRKMLKSMLCEVDLAVMPSRTEGFGLTGLEALSAGLPILVSRNSGFGEALSKVPFGSLFVIDSDIPKVWAEAIKNFADKSRSKRLVESEGLRTFYKEEYSWEKQSEELIGSMINIVHGCSVECQNAAKQRTFQPTDALAEHHPGIVPVVFQLDSVSFQNGFSGDPKQVMSEMTRHFLDTKAADIPAKDFPMCLHYYLQGVLDVTVRDANEGSLRITVECRTLEILERLWEDYRSGHLNSVAEECLLTDDIKQTFNVESVKLKTTIFEKDYLACKLSLMANSERDKDSTTNEEAMLLQDPQTGAVDETENQSAEEPEPMTLLLAVNYRERNQVQEEDNETQELLEAETIGSPVEELPQYLQNIQVIHDSRPTGTSKSTFRIGVECHNLEMLESLWNDYCSGHLNAVAEKRFLTDDIKRRFHVESVNIQTTILKEDYTACKEFLLKKTQSPESEENGIESDEKTRSQSTENTQIQSAEKTQIQSIEDTRTQSVEETQIKSVGEARSETVEETQIQSTEETTLFGSNFLGSDIDIMSNHLKRTMSDLKDLTIRYDEVLKEKSVLEKKLSRTSSDLLEKNRLIEELERRYFDTEAMLMESHSSAKKVVEGAAQNRQVQNREMLERTHFIIALQMKLLSTKEEVDNLREKLEESNNEKENLLNRFAHICKDYDNQRRESKKLTRELEIQKDNIQRAEELWGLSYQKLKGEKDEVLREVAELKCWTEALKVRNDIVEKDRKQTQESHESTVADYSELRDMADELRLRLTISAREIDDLKKRCEDYEQTANTYRKQRDLYEKAWKETVAEREQLRKDRDEAMCRLTEVICSRDEAIDRQMEYRRQLEQQYKKTADKRHGVRKLSIFSRYVKKNAKNLPLDTEKVKEAKLEGRVEREDELPRRVPTAVKIPLTGNRDVKQPRSLAPSTKRVAMRNFLLSEQSIDGAIEGSSPFFPFSSCDSCLHNMHIPKLEEIDMTEVACEQPPPPLRKKPGKGRL